MKKRLLMSAALAALAVPSFSLAQEQPKPNTGALHFGADFNFATSYFFRGYNQEDTGLIFQPNVFGFSDVVDSDQFDLRVKIGSWNSVHSEQTAGDDAWYESDIYGVVTATFNNNYYASLAYTFYTYPGDAFETIQELGLSGGVLDLTAFWDSSADKAFKLPVEVGFYKETDDGNGEEDFYAELKATPTLALGREIIPGFGKATIEVPLVLGTSLDGYYLDSDGDHEFLGYVSGGVTLGLPMAFIPVQYGAWTLKAGGNYIYLIADSAELANDGGEDYELQGWLGVSLEY